MWLTGCEQRCDVEEHKWPSSAYSGRLMFPDQKIETKMDVSVANVLQTSSESWLSGVLLEFLPPLVSDRPKTRGGKNPRDFEKHQIYLRKHNICQKKSRLRREIIYENTTLQARNYLRKHNICGAPKTRGGKNPRGVKTPVIPLMPNKLSTDACFLLEVDANSDTFCRLLGGLSFSRFLVIFLIPQRSLGGRAGSVQRDSIQRDSVQS